MSIKLDHAAKVALLEAVRAGEMEESLLRQLTHTEMTLADVEAEICRLDATEDRQYLANVADAMREFASGEITLAEYTAKRVDYVRQHSD